eukprot:m51a1_g10219 hypothetical protein (543) ;mRNA; r:117008-122666
MLGRVLRAAAPRTNYGQSLSDIVDGDAASIRSASKHIVAVVAKSGAGKTASVVELAHRYYVVYIVAGESNAQDAGVQDFVDSSFGRFVGACDEVLASKGAMPPTDFTSPELTERGMANRRAIYRLAYIEVAARLAVLDALVREYQKSNSTDDGQTPVDSSTAMVLVIDEAQRIVDSMLDLRGTHIPSRYELLLNGRMRFSFCVVGEINCLSAALDHWLWHCDRRSRLVFGTYSWGFASAGDAPAVFDEAVASCQRRKLLPVLFETAWIDRDGEAAFGQWLGRLDGATRAQVRIIHKAFFHDPSSEHGDHRTLAQLDLDTRQSLARLGVERVLVSLLHRDNTDIAVEDIARHMDASVGVTCEHWGVSNWSPERVLWLLRACGELRLRPPVLVSYYHSLAEPRAPLWPGTLFVGHSTTELLRFSQFSAMPLLAYSALSSGYFSGNVVAELETPENSERKLRLLAVARRLASPYSAQPIAGAAGARPQELLAPTVLAWVLATPLLPRVWASVAPKTPREVRQLFLYEALLPHVSPLWKYLDLKEQ